MYLSFSADTNLSTESKINLLNSETSVIRFFKSFKDTRAGHAGHFSGKLDFLMD